MNGQGDTLHALNLPRGGTVIEMRHSTFAKGAPYSWVSMARLWVMRYAFARKRARPLGFYSMHLPEDVTVASRELESCMLNASAQSAVHLSTDERWRCFWNVDVNVSFAHLKPMLERVASERQAGIVNLGKEDICRKRYWIGKMIRDQNGTLRPAGCPT